MDPIIVVPRHSAIFDDVKLNESDVKRCQTASTLEQATEMSWWERFKDWFTGSAQKEALTQLFKFSNGTPAEKEGAFDSLQRLCEPAYVKNFKEHIDIGAQCRQLVIHVGNGQAYAQAVPLSEPECATFMLKHYGDFYAAALDDQQAFVANFKDETVIKEWSDGLRAALASSEAVGYEDMSNKEYRYSELGQWGQKKFMSVMTDAPAVMSYLIENRNHPAVKEWRLQHPSPTALALPNDAQLAFANEVLEPVEGDLAPSGISQQAVLDWNRTDVTIGGQIYSYDASAAADALHALTGDRKLSELISRYANQGSLAPIVRQMENGGLPLHLPDGRDVIGLKTGGSFYSVVKEGDGSVRLDINYNVDDINYVLLREDGIALPYMTDTENSRFNSRFALRFTADYQVAVAAPLSYNAEFTLAKELLDSSRQPV